MKRHLTTLLLVFFAIMTWAQGNAVLDQLQADPKKAYGNDYPYSMKASQLTKTPKGYKPFYISHYARHGSRHSTSAIMHVTAHAIIGVTNFTTILTHC